MQNFIYIFTEVILPIFIQIGIGYAIQRKFKLNINTLTKIQFYVFIPALLFIKLFHAVIDLQLISSILLVLFLIIVSLYLSSYFISKLFKFNQTTRSSFINSICLINSGNYCIPLIELLFKANPVANAVQVIYLSFQSIVTNTVGVMNANLGSKSIKQSLLAIFKIPMLYAILLAIFFRTTSITIWNPIMESLIIIGDGMIPLALFTLGAQLSETQLSFRVPKVYLSNVMRLVVAPILAFLFVQLVGITGIAAQVIVIVSAAPTAVNSVLLAIEYDNEPELSSQIVFSSTLLSSITMSFVIYMAITYIVI